MKEDARSVSNQSKTRTIRRKFLRVLIGLDLIVVSVGTGVLYTQQKQSLIRDIDNTLRAVAVMAREILPPDYHDRIVGPDSVAEQEYEAIVDRYNRLCVSLGLEYIWSLMMIDGRPVFTSATSPDKVVGNRKHAKFFEVHSNPELYAQTFETMAASGCRRWLRHEGTAVPVKTLAGCRGSWNAVFRHAEVPRRFAGERGR